MIRWIYVTVRTMTVTPTRSMAQGMWVSAFSAMVMLMSTAARTERPSASMLKSNAWMLQIPLSIYAMALITTAIQRHQTAPEIPWWVLRVTATTRIFAKRVRPLAKAAWLFVVTRTPRKSSYVTVLITTAIHRRPTVLPSRPWAWSVMVMTPTSASKGSRPASMVCLAATIPTTKILRSATKSIMTATVKSMRTSPIPTERDFRIAWTMMTMTTALQTI